MGKRRAREIWEYDSMEEFEADGGAKAYGEGIVRIGRAHYLSDGSGISKVGIAQFADLAAFAAAGGIAEYGEGGQFIGGRQAFFAKPPSLSRNSAHSRAFLDQISDGRYLGTSRVEGSAARQISVYSEDYALLSNIGNTYSSGTMLSPSGVAVGINCVIHHIWALPDGNFLYHVFDATSGNSFIFRCVFNSGNPGASTVGNNSPAFDNKRAVLALGSSDGLGTGQIGNVRILSKTGLAIATYKEVTTLYIAEYSVASGRVAGSTNDAVRIWQSTDLGQTWTKLYEWNTNGTTRQIDHLHSVLKSPNSRDLYFTFGDVPGACGILTWDGVSPWPANNLSLKQFKNQPGFTVMHDESEWYRACDLCFSDDGVYWLPDSDDDSTGYAYVSLRATGDIKNARRTGTIERIRRLPPINAAYDHNRGIGFYVSLRTGSPTVGDPPRECWIWGTGDRGETWRVVAKVLLDVAQNSQTTWSSFYFNKRGQLVLAGLFARSVSFISLDDGITNSPQESAFSLILDIAQGGFSGGILNLNRVS